MKSVAKLSTIVARVKDFLPLKNSTTPFLQPYNNYIITLYNIIYQLITKNMFYNIYLQPTYNRSLFRTFALSDKS